MRVTRWRRHIGGRQAVRAGKRVAAGLLGTLLLYALTYGMTHFITRGAYHQFNRLVRHAHPVAHVPYASLINASAAREALDPTLVAAVIAVESGFNPRAVSPKGACGLMQITLPTWQVIHKAEPAVANDFTLAYDPAVNIAAGSRHLAALVRRYGGDMVLALAAYNAGPGSVSRYQGIPPFPETQEYVTKVIGQWCLWHRDGWRVRLFFGPALLLKTLADWLYRILWLAAGFLIVSQLAAYAARK